MDFLDKQIAPPKSWEKFEDLTRSLFAAVWQNPLTQKNGRTGQPQCGVDIVGEPDGLSGTWHGIQCKGKDRAYGAKATTKEFTAELLKAEQFRPGLSRWIFATTAPNDAALQQHAREISAARVAAKKFPVEVLGWESLLALLAEHPRVLRQFYPEHVAVESDRELVDEASSAAIEAIDDVLRHDSASVSLVRPDAWRAIEEAMARSNILRITGDGGSGKSGLLRRLGVMSVDPIVAIKDNRTTATSLRQHLTQLGVSGSIEALLDDLASGGSALCLVDGADRLLMSDRRGVVLDLFRALAAPERRDRWQIVTTARSFQEQDLVATALIEAGFEQSGIAVYVSPLTKGDMDAIGVAFPVFAPLTKRTDLGGQNRSLFLLRELLARQDNVPQFLTEIDIAGAWAGADRTDTGLAARRGKALSELGRKLLSDPSKRPARADFDPLGLQALIDEGSVIAIPNQDAVGLAYDVHEDWLIARSLVREGTGLPTVLRNSGEPLWWQRAVRLVGQILLERGHDDDWLAVLNALDAEPDLDPAWTRAILVAPLYSERAADILPRLEGAYLAHDGKLLARLLDTLIVFETRIDEALMASDLLAHLNEAQRYAVADHWKQPLWRSWAAFLQWSLHQWEAWPATLVSRLADVALIFARASARVPNAHAQVIGRICGAWLVTIEDSLHPENWDDRSDPFDLNLPRRQWEKIEDRLREALSYTVASAPSAVAAYLQHLTQSRRLEEPRAKLLGSPNGIPAALPSAWVDMCLRQFLPKRRRFRSGPEMPIGPELFSWHDMHHAGINDDHRFFPTSPLRGGFAALFEANETEALRLFHRLEMHAAVFWRWYVKCEDRKQPRPLVLRMPWGDVALWGDETVYRWSIGVLGSNVLGSAYLALDDWMSAQAAKGRPVSELLQLTLQNNGLVASAAPCIAMLREQINAPGAIDSAGPFLAEPRLWSFDIRRHIDEQGGAHRIGFWSPHDVHLQAVEALRQRHAPHQPLAHSMLVPFRLLARKPAQARFDARRAEWQVADLASYAEELDDPAAVAEFEAQIHRCRSNSDAGQIVFEPAPAENQIRVTVAPPPEAEAEIAAFDEQRKRLNRATRLANWVTATRERRQLNEDLTIEEAISLAKEVALEGADARNGDDFGLTAQMAGAGIVGTAAVAAHYAGDELVQAHRQWIERWLYDGARLRRAEWEAVATIDEAILPYDVQVFAGWGLAALTCRAPGSPEAEGLVIALAVQRLHAVTAAVIEGLTWENRPEFARKVTVAALDSCVIDVGHWWAGEKEKRKALVRTTKRRERAFRKACRQGSDEMPVLPPAPNERRWVWTWRWRKPLRRVPSRAKVVLDWNKAKAVLERVDWSGLSKGDARREGYAAYLKALVEWTRAYSEGREDRYGSRFPYEWGHALARVLGRFAAVQGRSEDWRSLQLFTYHGRAENLVGDYIDAVAHELIESGRRPDERFWAAWRAPAEWIMERSIPRKRDDYDSLPQEARAAGFVGPYMTPIPPDWPHLEDLLGTINTWLSATSHLPSAAYALLPIVERMSIDQRLRWFLPWLIQLTKEHGADESFWSYDGLGNKAAALLKPLSAINHERRREARQCLAFLADAGSTVARELLPSFAAKRPRS